MNLSALAPGALKVARTCVSVQPGEHVLVLTDPGVSSVVAEALAFAAISCGGTVATLMMPLARHPGRNLLG